MSDIPIQFTLNGRTTKSVIEPEDTLVDLLRKNDLFGARESCGQGLCGCCTVLVDDIAVTGCLELAALVDGKRIDTIEGCETDGELSPMQQAFVDEGAFQCGFCTPGFVLMAQQLLKENPSPSEDEIRDYLSGNLCRCAAYPEIIRAVHSVANSSRGSTNV